MYGLYVNYVSIKLLKKSQPLQFPTNPTLVHTVPQAVINGSESLNSSPICYPWFR